METLERDRDGRPDRELYALLHLSPEASDDDVKRAYRQWAQVYHPDKHQTPQMQDIATQNFQRIREAYEILSDERKRQIYDLYGMEGLSSGLELGPKLKSREEVRAEFERLQQRQEERKLAAHVHQRGSLLMNLSLVPFLRSYDAPRISGMAMSTQVQAQVSKKDTVVLGGNMALRRGVGGGSVTMVLRRQLSPISSVELLAMAGVRSVLSVQTSRQLSTHSTGTSGLSVSLRDGSVTLSNTWSRQLSEDTTGNIQLEIGPDTGLSVGWQRHAKKNAGSADVKVGPATFGLSGQYIRHFSSKSQGRVTGKIGSTGMEVEVGGERRLSEHSSAAMFCVLGLQGVSWKVRFTRGGQKFVIPIMLCTTLNPFIATGALIIPSSIYAVLKTFVLKPYNVRRNRRKSLDLRRATYAQVVEARGSSEKAQMLLKNVAERKKQKQAQRQGLVILSAVYGDIKAYERGASGADKATSEEDDDADLPPPYLDVGIPIQFLVDDFGQLRLHEGVKKAGLMGFCDPCPGESKQLKVAYSYLGHLYEVVVGDYDELRIPQEAHRIQRSASERLDQRSSFWLQYGRVRQHLQACDLLLEQINRCAVPPGGRPEMDMPAGIMRRDDRGSVAARSLCEIPAHVVPESPFDVALDLGFNRGEGVHPTKEGAEGDENGGGGQDSMNSAELEAFTSGGDCCGDGEVGGAGWDEEGSGGGGRGAGSMGDGSGECDHHDGSREWMRGSENVVVDLDPGADATVERGASPSAGSDVGMDMDGMAVARGGEGRVRKRSVGCSPMSVGVPGKSVELAPVNFISAASYYVEGPSKAEPSRGGNSTTRRTSFCRIEAFVIRSRSARAMAVQEEETKRTAAKSAGVDFE